MDSYFGDSGPDDFGSIGGGFEEVQQPMQPHDPMPTATTDLTATNHAQTHHNAIDDANGLDYFGASSSTPSDPFFSSGDSMPAAASSSSASEATQSQSQSQSQSQPEVQATFQPEATQQQPLGDATLVDEPITDVDLNNEPKQTESAPEPQSADSTPAPPAATPLTPPAPAPAPVQTISPPSTETTSVSSYFGSSSGDDGLGDLGLGDVSLDSSSVPEAAPVAASSNVASYFGSSSDFDDGLSGIGGSGGGDENGSVDSNIVQAGSGLGYFDSVPAADDWMNGGSSNGNGNITNTTNDNQQTGNFFDSFTQQSQQPFAAQHQSPSFQSSPYAPPQQPQPQPPTPVMAAPANPDAPKPIAANGLPTHAHQDPAPAPSAAPAPAPAVVPPAATAVTDYFGSATGSDDWLAQPAPPTQTQPPPQQQQYNQPPPQPQQAQYGAYPPPQATHSAYPPASHGAPQSAAAFPPSHLVPRPGHLAPPPSRQVSDLLNDVDLNSPSAGLDDVPLGPTHASTAPTTINPHRGYDAFRQNQTPQTANAHMHAQSQPQSQPISDYPARPPMPTTNPYAPSMAGPDMAPPSHPYGTPSSPASIPPQPVATESGRGMPPSTFMPRQIQPMPTAAPTQQTAAAGWPNQPTQINAAPTHQNGMQAMQPGYPARQPPQHTQNAYAPAQPNLQSSPPGGPSNLFAPSVNMFQPQSGGVPGVMSPSASRPWCPPAAHPLVSFGFGGKLLTVIPRESGGALKAGPVTITPLSSMLEQHSWVQKLTSFPGPLCQPSLAAGGTYRHPRHVELEDLVQSSADRALYASLPTDSPLQASTQDQAHVLNNFRQSKRLLNLLLLECLKRDGRIHRATNPQSINTLPASANAPKGSTVEEHIMSYLVQLDGNGNGSSAGATNPAASSWLDNSSFGGESVAAPVAPRTADPTSLVDERTRQDQTLEAMQILLLKGQRKEACMLAVERKLWSHALLLASFDMATYHMVVGKFAMESFVDGAPQQSLYLLFAQQPNLLFRGVAGPDGKGMDGQPVPGPHLPLFNQPTTPPLLKSWRASLTILLANPTPNDKQVLTTLGDTLWQNYHLPDAAHMVYLLSGHGLGPEVPGQTPSALPLGRVLLVGADHRKHMRTFATPGAIQRTEIFEYTRQLASQANAAAPAPAGGQQPTCAFGGISPPLTMFKLLYAYQLAEVGLNTRALAYVDHLTSIVQLHSKAGKGALTFSPTFLTSLDQLDHRLRESMNKVAGPGIGKKIVNKLFNWMVGDSAQAPGTTTVVAPDIKPDPNLSGAPAPLPRSVSSSALPQPVPAARGMSASASEFNLNGYTSSSLVGGESTSQPLQPPIHSRSVTEPNSSPPPTAAAAVAATPTKKKEEVKPSTLQQEGGEVKPGLFGSIVGSLWGKKSGKKVHRAHIREESSFAFDETLGRWVQRDANGNIVEEEEEKPVAPPSISPEMQEKLRNMSSTAPPPMPSPAAAAGSPSPAPPVATLPGMPPPPSMFASRGVSGAKGRYALADNSYEDASVSAPLMSAPLPPAGFPAPTAGVSPPGANGPTQPAPFKVFRPAAGAAPMESPYASPANGAQPTHANPQPADPGMPAAHHAPHNAQVPSAAAPYGGMVAPPMPAASYGAPTPHSFPPPPQPAYGGQMQHGYPSQPMPNPYQPPADLRAQSTPPMRPGAVPAGGYVPYGAPPMMPTRPPMPTMPTGATHTPMQPYGAPYMPQRPAY